MSGIHAVLSPSKGAMILRCAAALAAGKNAPNPPSEYAAEGTAYHEIAAFALEHGTECAEEVGKMHEADGFKFTIDEENAAHAQKYVDAIRKIPGAQYYEVRLDTSDVVGVSGQGGTGDAITLDFEHDTIHVDDLKFGRGEVVFAENNEQLIQYGAAALRKFALSHDWKFVKLGIHQPRINHYSEHTYTVEEIDAWVKENKPRFKRAYSLYQNPMAVTAHDFTPGDKQCRWCPIKGSCAARANKMLDMFPVAEPFQQTGAPLHDLVHRQPAKTAPTLLTDEALAAARDRVDTIEQWCSDIKAEAHTRAVMLGRTLPGWKVVNGRAGNRKWIDPALAERVMVEKLADGAFKPREIISPTEAEKKLKKKEDLAWAVLVGNMHQTEGAKSLVRDDSPKQAVATGQVEFPVQAPV